MPPFLQSQLVTGFKDKVDCLHVAGQCERADGSRDEVDEADGAFQVTSSTSLSAVGAFMFTSSRRMKRVRPWTSFKTFGEIS
jgi:hypothetical protein